MSLKLNVIVIDEESDTNLVKLKFAAERERVTDKIGTALAQSVVKSLGVGGLAGFLSHSEMAFRREYGGIGIPKVRVANGALAIIGR